MALKKNITKDGKHTEVTFKLDPNNIPSESDIFLIGDFNNWRMADEDFKMEKKRGSYVRKVTLKNGSKYEFRYVNLDFTWFNDDAADSYVPSPFHGIDNSVVDLTNVVKPKRAVKKSNKEDLTKIEGIGPKIAGLLAENGINTFKLLSEAKVKTLATILENAGSRYRMHKPNSWPKQAKLAHQGKWDELKKLQDKLDGGK
ncbi:hypothetical protein GCM10011414_02530 [Croceivirga lutea]|uniref:helix-hairpin-helix domain-containing protein n=1 Tax=Croceivirga lutea TaxID=1775167 RepID=UPI00163A7E70|nr:helix-hairpin-helix domain-containing protein [Croceivirga lutea]GGG36675.1 hypothetical protein GCM10011414_02530 [Croceivirga lutea]